MINRKLIQGFSIARSGVYFLESIPLQLVNRWLTKSKLQPPNEEQAKSAWIHLYELHKIESENIAQGVYPLSALDFENPIAHARSFFEVLRDGFRVAWRMRNNQTKDFDSQSEQLRQGLPQYYTRNFHFQTDGYLSEPSARRYDHQVEILFTGAAGAMRRMILPVLKLHTQDQGQWLELACGAGSATRPVLETFTKAKITALDLSSPYLKVAQEKLRNYPNIDFIQGDATNLDFKNETFSAVYCVYLLHELPRREREKVIQEAYRVLKPGGLLVFADSLQTGDESSLDWALERFPKVYHEPFYKDYLSDKLEDLFQRVTGVASQIQHALFTKVVWLKKPLTPESND